MIDSKYARAYVEVLEIIKYLPKEEYEKIPIEKIEFYKKNIAKDYKFTINPEIDLSEQNISKEASAIIVNLFQDYFATESQKAKIREILELNQKKEEQAKRQKYNPDILLKEFENTKKNGQETALIEYKETFFIRLKKFILKLLNLMKE